MMRLLQRRLLLMLQRSLLLLLRLLLLRMLLLRLLLLRLMLLHRMSRNQRASTVAWTESRAEEGWRANTTRAVTR